MPVRVELFLPPGLPGFLLFCFVTLYEFGQGTLSLMRGKGSRNPLLNVCMAETLLISPVASSPPQYGFRLIVQLRCRYALSHSHPFVLVRYRMDMYLPVVRPHHQFGL